MRQSLYKFMPRQNRNEEMLIKLHDTHYGIPFSNITEVKLNSIAPDRTFLIAGFNVTVISNVLFVSLI